MSLSGEAVLYATSPNDVLAQQAARQERRRRKILKELFDTEKTYIHHLKVLNKHFYFPMRFAYIVPDDVLHIIFSNLEQIQEINVTLLEKMEQSTVGEAFCQMGPFLKLYSTYANNHQHASNTLMEWQSKSQPFADLIGKQEEHPEVGGLKLPALLITPVQRIPRYKLLLEDLLNHTSVEHHDYQKLKGAAALIAETALHINEYMRQNENFMKVLSIQRSFDSSAPKLLSPGRTFIKEGPLKKVSRKGGKSQDRMFFLFSDIMLYGKPKFLDGGGRSYTCSCVLPLRHCKVEPVFMTNVKKTEAEGGGLFRLTCKEESLLLYSDDMDEAKDWSEEIDRAIRKLCDDRQTLRKPSSNKIPLRGRSLRRHRQQQKKEETKVFPMTPLRPVSLVRSDDSDYQNQSRAYADDTGTQFGNVESLDLSIAEDRENMHPVRRSPYPRKKPKSNRNSRTNVEASSSFGSDSVSEASEKRSLRSSGSDISLSPLAFKTKVNEATSNYGHRVGKIHEEEHTDTQPQSCGSITLRERSRGGALSSSCSSIASTASSAYFPPNSPAHKHLNQRKGIQTRLKSYIQRPLKRFQKAKHQVTTPCSPFKCRRGTEVN